MRVGIPRTQHLRYRRFDRIDRQKLIPRFLGKEATDLAATAATVTVTPTATTASAAATRVLTLAANAANTETVTIGSAVYTFRTALTAAARDVLVGATAQASIDNLVAAINREHGKAGVVYSSATVAHPDVTAVRSSASTMTITANIAGIAANSIATTEGMGSGSWAGATMAGGVARVNASLAATAHGLTTGAGPLKYTAATTMPTGLSATGDYFAIRDSADALGLARTREDAFAGRRVQFSSTGAGAQTVARGVTQKALFERVRLGKDPRAVASAVDVDAL